MKRDFEGGLYRDKSTSGTDFQAFCIARDVLKKWIESSNMPQYSTQKATDQDGDYVEYRITAFSNHRIDFIRKIQTNKLLEKQQCFINI